MEQTETKTYLIGGRTFTAPPVVARQEKWIWPVIKPLFQKGEAITVEDIFAMMGESITFLAAVLLIPDGQTQAHKIRQGMEGIKLLELWLDETVSVSELGPVIADFFASGQQWKLVQGLAGPLRQAATTGSTTPSAPLPMETSGKPNGSGTTSDSARPPSISNAAGSDEQPSAPSLVSAG